MAKIRSMGKIAEKYGRVTPGKATELEAGLRNPKKSWEEETLASVGAYNAGVSDAIARDAFSKGVSAAGQASYIGPALELGVKRYRDGVTYGVPKYNRNFAPYRDVIEQTSLPPRGATGDPGNIDRVRVIAAALHDAKIK